MPVMIAATMRSEPAAPLRAQPAGALLATHEAASANQD
jgi:hypothetical protein